MIQSSDISRIRNKLRETQAQFADRLGVNQGTISRWERETPENRIIQRLLQSELKRWLPKNGKAA